MTLDANDVERELLALQASLVQRFEALDGQGTFALDRWRRSEDTHGATMVLDAGRVFERAGVNFSRVKGPKLPPAATERRPELAGVPFEAQGVSVVLHPRNPYAPTAHMNVRLIRAFTEQPTHWFGGGFDLTPYYGFEEDARSFHAAAKNVSERLHPDAYERFKKHCDEYFFLKHRNEPRGIGGIFFDDLGPTDPMTQSFEHTAQFILEVGAAFGRAYGEIVERRKDTPYDDAQRQWQLYRRGRYVEFNLVLDRGTTFGLQSGGRTESILMSLPPLVRWQYDHHPAPGSEEARLYTDFLRPRDWV